MKKLMILLSVGILLSCQSSKNDLALELEEETKIELTMIAKLKDNSPFQYIPLDSTRFTVYKISDDDTTIISRKYTGSSGKVTMTIERGNKYYLEAMSRTYKFTYNTQPHYYLYGKNVSSNESTYNTFTTQDDFGATTRITGYGCTNYYIQDPTE